MSRIPIGPLVRWNIIWMMIREFHLSPERAEHFTTQFIEGLRRRGFEILREADDQGRREMRWEDLPAMAEMLEADRNGIKPWDPPELK